ncbi:MAG: DUF4010 domain-containing protein [Methylotenera sp.]|nr:DUF4010 domain-containing protein [Methylotenera sp.]
MEMNDVPWVNFAVALGIGLLIGAERERKKVIVGERRRASLNSSSIAGVRTFTIAALLGAVSIFVDFWLLITALICVTLFVTATNFVAKKLDHSLTTHVSLVFTVILGGLAMSTPSLSASLAVATAILLAAKEPIHWFVRGAVTKEEMFDFLILAAATLIVLPLVPNAHIGPFDAINPYNLWLIVILVMFIGALGHLSLRLLGTRSGLPLVGLVSGFISSIATIAAMGAHVKKTPELMAGAVAGATLSSLSTILFLATLLVAVDLPTLYVLIAPLTFGGVVIGAYGLVVTLSSLRFQGVAQSTPERSFSVKTALTLAAVIAAVLIVSAALKMWFGQAGLVLASGLAGMVDAHAASISAASLSASGKITTTNAAVAILVAFSINAISKAITAIVTGSKMFAQKVILGLAMQVFAVWLGWALF